MAEVAAPLLHCYRCIYSWRPVQPLTRICPRCKSRLWNVPKILPSPSRTSGLGVEEILGPHRRAIGQLRRRYGIASLRVFGSVARREARPDSDVDLLVEYRRPSDIFTRTRLRRELERVLGRRVDLVREEMLHWAVRPQAVAEAVTV